MRRGFTLWVDPEEVRTYLTNLGYKTEDAYYRHGGDPFGFYIQDTTIQVDYGIVVDGRAVARGGVSLNNTPVRSGNDPDKAERSLKLYQKLYRKYRKLQKN